MSDFSAYTAGQIADWLSQGTVEAPPSSLWVALIDDTGTELSSDLQNGRVETTAGTDWTIVNGSDFENAAEIDFGEALADITIQEVAVYDSDTGGSNNELFRDEVDNFPEDVLDGTRVFYAAGDLVFDVLDRTE